MMGLLGIPPGMPKSEIPLLMRAIAGICSGAVASFLANPLDLAKVRMQVSKKSRGLSGTIMLIVQQEGVLALWKGVGPTCARAAFLTAGELVAQGEAKRMLLATGLMNDGECAMRGLTAGSTDMVRCVGDILLIFCAAMCSGFVGVGLSNPFDVAKSRVMGQALGPDGKGKEYSGMIDCFQKSIANEGIGCLMKGFSQNFTRKGPHVVIVFLCIEQIKNLMDVYGDTVLLVLIVLGLVLYMVGSSGGQPAADKKDDDAKATTAAEKKEG